MRRKGIFVFLNFCNLLITCLYLCLVLIFHFSQRRGLPKNEKSMISLHTLMPFQTWVTFSLYGHKKKSLTQCSCCYFTYSECCPGPINTKKSTININPLHCISSLFVFKSYIFLWAFPITYLCLSFTDDEHRISVIFLVRDIKLIRFVFFVSVRLSARSWHVVTF